MIKIEGGQAMDMTTFQTFREVARRGSFTRAAEALGYAQSSITAQIQKLEQAYGVTLFERAGRQMRLTPPGEELLKFVLPMLDLYAESMEKISQQMGGTLTIGTIDSLAAYVMPTYLQQLRVEIPGLSVHLFPDREDVLLAKVKEGDYDIGLLLDRIPADPALQCQVVREEPLVLIAEPGHALSTRAQVEIADLEDCEFIMTEGSCLYRSMFELLLKDTKIRYRTVFELGNLEAVKHCVMKGLGIALLPRVVAEGEIQRGSLAVIPFHHPDLRIYLQWVMHPKKWRSAALDHFIRLIDTVEAELQ
nr:LysR family transcriptional regulator [Paenibacillus terrigena]